MLNIKDLTISADDDRPSMAAVAAQRAAPLPKFNFKIIVEHAGLECDQVVPRFDPNVHLKFTPPTSIIKMEDIGYDENIGVSPVAVSQPFQLFSPEAVQHMRTEIFNPEVLKNCSFQSNLAACQLRGYASEYAPFTYEAWKHPETLKIISEVAGIDLVPEMDYEIAHINLSVKSDEQTKKELATINRQKRWHAEDEGIGGCPWEDDKPIVGWHTDSYPFVCVTMLSDCTDMVGGETALRTADGHVIKIRGPTQGCAVVLQGRYLTHQALRALGTKERITSVTSFRPRTPHVKDDSVLTTVRPISDVSELYFEFAEYRLEIMEERIRQARKEMAARRQANLKFDTDKHKKFLEESIAFLEHDNSEIVEESKIIAGYIEEVDYPDVVVEDTTEADRPAKRGRND